MAFLTVKELENFIASVRKDPPEGVKDVGELGVCLELTDCNVDIAGDGTQYNPYANEAMIADTGDNIGWVLVLKANAWDDLSKEEQQDATAAQE